MTLLIGEEVRLGFVPIFISLFPIANALSPLPVLETSSLQVLVLFKTVQSSWFFSRLTCTSSRSSIRYHNEYTKEYQSHENDIIPCHRGWLKF